jgi:hypothetical protein
MRAIPHRKEIPKMVEPGKVGSSAVPGRDFHPGPLWDFTDTGNSVQFLPAQQLPPKKTTFFDEDIDDVIYLD